MDIQELKIQIDNIDETLNQYIIAAFTDEYYVDRFNNEAKEKLMDRLDKALEIRVFGDDSEYKFFRTDISREFLYRHIVDSDNDNEYYDEEQFLDIDDTRTIGDSVYATGGGQYNLPIANKKNAKIKIRYYFGKYEDTGHAYIKDWRVVNFVEGKWYGKL